MTDTPDSRMGRLLTITDDEGQIIKRSELMRLIRQVTEDVMGSRADANLVLLSRLDYLPGRPTALKTMMDDRNFRRQTLHTWMGNIFS